jgi:hypothetical protein
VVVVAGLCSSAAAVLKSTPVVVAVVSAHNGFLCSGCIGQSKNPLLWWRRRHSFGLTTPVVPVETGLLVHINQLISAHNDSLRSVFVVAVDRSVVQSA